MADRDRRRRRILEKGQDRMALISRRKNDPDPTSRSQPLNGQTSATYIEEEETSHSMPSAQYEQAVKPLQHDQVCSLIREEPFVRKPVPRAEPSRVPRADDVILAGPSAAVPKPVLVAADVALRLAQKIPLRNVSAQQVIMAVAETEHGRMLCTLLVAVLVILSYAGLPIVGSGSFRRVILFRPLFLLIIADIALIVRRLIPLSMKNLVKGEKDDTKSILGDGFAWAEAGRALELGLILQSVMGALFADCTIYAAVIIFFLAPFG